MGIAIIHDKEVVLKHYEGNPVITLSEVDMLHEKSGSARRNFSYHSERFIEGIDYYLMPINEFRRMYNYDIDNKRGNPNIEVVLLTKFGYMLLAKTFNDDLAWNVQRALVERYFDTDYSKPAPPALNSFDYLRQMIDVMEEQSNRIDAHDERIDRIERQMELVLEPPPAPAPSEPLLITIPEGERMYSASAIAKRLDLYSAKSGQPHARLINEIAYHAGLPVTLRHSYRDDYLIVEVKMTPDTGEKIYLIHYTPKGLEKVAAWFHANKDDGYFETFRQRSSKAGKKGSLMSKGFKFGRFRYYIA